MKQGAGHLFPRKGVRHHFSDELKNKAKNVHAIPSTAAALGAEE